MSRLPDLRDAVPQLATLVRDALAEDMGEDGDVTTALLFPEYLGAHAAIVSEAEGVLAGLGVAEAVFRQLEYDISFSGLVAEGARIGPGSRIVELAGDARAILTAERTALNFLGRLSGIATLTSEFVTEAAFSGEIRDTRKTTPGLRSLEKYAVAVGGGSNHRFGLFDAVIIKDNHLRALGDGVSEAIERARKAGSPVEVEVETLVEVKTALDAGADVIMLDNMGADDIAAAVRIVDKQAVLEASGGIHLGNVAKIAAAGVDWISVGALTHSAVSLDFSLEIIEAR